MDRAVYDRMAEAEAEHWWFRGRRAVLQSVIETRCTLPTGARILDAGCGTGGNLEMLSKFGDLDAFEFDADARAMAAAKGVAHVAFGALPDAIDAPDGSYDLIGLFDVLEHIEDDHGSLVTLGRKLKPEGSLLISVPAMPWLWSEHDVSHHHKRRYTRSSLSRVIEAAGLDVEVISYFNTLLFPLAVAQRVGQRITLSNKPADAMPPPWLNASLGAVFAAERHLAGRVPLPFGLSLFAIACRR